MTENFLHIKKGGYVSKALLFAYLNGELNDAENKRIAKLVEEDPFLADAIEGLKNADSQEITNALNGIYKDVDIIVGNKKAFILSSTFKMYAAAAMILVFFGLTFLIMNQLTKSANQQTDIALAEEKSELIIIDDSSDMGSGSSTDDSFQIKANRNKPESKSVVPEISENVVFEEYAITYDEKRLDSDLVGAESEESAPVKILQEETLTTTGSVVNTNAEKKIASAETVDAVKLNKKSEKDKKPKISSKEATTDLDLADDNFSVVADTFTIVEQQPEYISGIAGVNKYLADNINYNLNNTDSGVVYVKFLVNEIGAISNVSILRGISDIADAEVMRVVKGMPNWKPGYQNGVPVKVWMSIPVKYEPGK